MVAEKSKLIESLKESGTEIKESRQKLEVLQKEKNDLVNEIETLKVKADRYEQYRIEVEEEKKEINSILTKERDARHKAEVQLTNLENHIEELQGAKRSKFMCF
ncbi:unnamed protein product [Rhizophagus irregularis]|nr:unnamed protein product [Rhizophagus irregularis]